MFVSLLARSYDPLLSFDNIPQSKRGDNDLYSLQASMRKANEMDAIYLEEMKTALPRFVQVRDKGKEAVNFPHCLCMSSSSVLLYS